MLRARPGPVRRPRRTTDGDGETAVVIGAGISGLLAARVLADVFDRVLVLERDALPDGPEFRPGVPQARHAHVLLARGQSICEELFPGLSAELEAAGAPPFDTGYTDILFPHGPAEPSPCGISVLMASRPLLETHIRRRVTALNGVVIQDATRVTGLSFDDCGARVRGVRAAGRGPGHTWKDDAAVAAALVVDASGRASKLAQWLRAAGRQDTQETVVDPRVGYASRIYDVPEQRRGDPAFSGELLYAPRLTRGYGALRIEGDRLLVTLQGAGGDRPPRDEEGFTAFARSLRSPLQSVLDDLSPASAIYQFTRTSNRKVAYHTMRDWPGGLVAIGDSVCTFNPLYAHGMSVAAMEALVLRQLVADGRDLSSARCRQFQRRVARTIAWPWLLATQSDRGWQEDHQPGHTERAAHWFLDQWIRAIPGDPMMYHRFLRVAHLLAGPASLLCPSTLAAMFRSRSRSEGLSVHDSAESKAP